MFDPETPVIALTAIFAIALTVLFSSALIEPHTIRQTWLTRIVGTPPQPRPRSSLWVERVIAVVFIGVSQLVMAAAVISPISGWATRAIAGSELLAFVAWIVYLTRASRNPG